MSDAQDELKNAVAKIMTDYGVDFYEGNLMHRTEQRLSLIDEFQNDMAALIQQSTGRLYTQEEFDKAASDAVLEYQKFILDANYAPELGTYDFDGIAEMVLVEL